MTSLTRAADLAEEWGWFPERAGIMAAESWGIMPQWQGRTLLESYQFQRNVFAPVVMIRMAAAEPELLPELPPLTSVPAVPAGFCEIVGEVSDEKLDPVKGAVVEIVGTGKTAETDSKGAFSFAAVAAGNLTLKASKLGYSSDSQTATGMPGQKLSIRMMLRVKAADAASDETTLDEETVVGEYQESESGNGMLLDVQSTPVVASSITSADFGKVGANDAASAIGKVAGANIVGGKFAVVRGLADRYVTTQFNGATISSADPSRKAVQLDIFPTNALQGIDVNKTYHPRLPGDFGGGTIRINTLSIPNERISQFKYKIGTNSNLGERMLVHPNRSLGFWGKATRFPSMAAAIVLCPATQPTRLSVNGKSMPPRHRKRPPRSI